jgi:ribosomal protein L40E
MGLFGFGKKKEPSNQVDTRVCTECGLLNPVNFTKCQTCGGKLGDKGILVFQKENTKNRKPILPVVDETSAKEVDETSAKEVDMNGMLTDDKDSPYYGVPRNNQGISQNKDGTVVGYFDKDMNFIKISR